MSTVYLYNCICFCLVQISERTKPTANRQCNVVAQTDSSPKQCEKEASPRRPVKDKHIEGLSARPSPKIDQTKKQQITLSPKPIPAKLLPPSCSAEKRDAKVESENRTQSVSHNVTESLYQRKDHRPIPRLDPSHLPQHYICPQYEILDNDCTKQDANKLSRLSKLDQMRHKKRQSEWIETSPKPLNSSKDEPEKIQRNNAAHLWKKKLSPRHSREAMLSSGPLTLDRMELAKGVSLLDPQEDDSSFRFNLPVLSAKLMPIRRDATVPLYSVEDVTTGPPP